MQDCRPQPRQLHNTMLPQPGISQMPGKQLYFFLPVFYLPKQLASKYHINFVVKVLCTLPRDKQKIFLISLGVFVSDKQQHFYIGLFLCKIG